MHFSICCRLGSFTLKKTLFFFLINKMNIVAIYPEKYKVACFDKIEAILLTKFL